jgi:hypothetical protein
VVAADFNRDGARDLAVLSQAGNAVRIFLGHGDGTLVASETYPVGVFPRALAVGDFNGDGRTDLAVANGGDGTVSILRNRGQ